MRQIRNLRFPNSAIDRVARFASRRVRGVVSPDCRHVSWVSAIVGKFACRRRWPAFGSQSMVQARLSRRLNLFFQSFLTQAWLLAQGEHSKRMPTLAPALQPANQNFLRSPIATLPRILTVGSRPASAPEKAHTGVRDYAPGRMQLFAPARSGGPIFKDEAGTARSLKFVRYAEHSVGLPPAVHRSNRTKQRFGRHDIAESSIRLSAAVHGSNRAKQRFERKGIDDSESGPRSVVTRIGQKHRRVEEYRLIERRELQAEERRDANSEWHDGSRRAGAVAAPASPPRRP